MREGHSKESWKQDILNELKIVITSLKRYIFNDVKAQRVSMSKFFLFPMIFTLYFILYVKESKVHILTVQKF